MTRAFLFFVLAAGCSSSHHNAPGVDAGADVSVIDGSATDVGLDSQAPFDAGSLGGACPPGLDPYATPYEACDPEGATCRNDGGQCGSVLACECNAGLWNCVFAHPDPVCTCGREPSEGDPCVDEGTSCGACCPTGDDPDWAPMTCVDGTWQPALCAPECPEPATGSCPAVPRDHIGDDCPSEGLICGNACCGTATECNRGVWRAGPDAGCACTPQRACGAGFCRENQYCVQSCGPADGPEYTCEALPEACADCSCIPLDPGLGRCDMVDGAPTIGHFCG